MNYVDILPIINAIAIPVVGGIIVWIWKLDARVFDLRASVLTRDEFQEQMRELRAELALLRTTLIHHRD